MRLSPLRDKRYNSLHLFCRVFSDDYVAPPIIKNWFHFRRRIQHLFISIEHIHRDLFQKKPFMSYTWLLHKLFRLLKQDAYLRFIKILKCPKRTRVYENNFEIIKRALYRSDRYGVTPDVFGENVQLRVEHEVLDRHVMSCQSGM